MTVHRLPANVWRSLVAMVAVVTLVGAACARGADRLPGADRTMLSVCSTGDYRPFTFRDANQTWQGLDIDMARNLAQHLDRTLQLVATTWQNLLTDVGARCDVAMGGITMTAARARRALFSAPYLRDGKAAIIRCADAAKYRTLTDIDQPGVRVVENPGGTNEEFARTHITRARLLTYPDNNNVFGQLTSGAADAMVTDTSEIRYQTMQNRQLCGVAVDHPFTTDEKAYLLPHGATALRDALNQWLATAQTDGTYAAASRHYLGAVIGP